MNLREQIDKSSGASSENDRPWCILERTESDFQSHERTSPTTTIHRLLTSFHVNYVWYKSTQLH